MDHDDRIAKAAAEDDDEDQVSRLENIRPVFVSLVDYGANWGGQRHFFVLKRDAVAKAVPDKDASTEDKEAARAARSTKYGIQVLESGSRLTYPAGAPTSESLYGDPVNLKYPLGYTDERDAGRIRNALARFKQNASAYTEEASRGRVYERIVRAALAEDIEVSFDPEDAVDALLPGDLKDRLSKAEPAPTGPSLADLAKQIAERAQILDVGGKILALPKVQPPAATPAAPPDGPTVAGDRESGLQKRVDELERANAQQRAELEQTRQTLKAERVQRARLAKSTGRLTGIPGTAPTRTRPAKGPEPYPLDYNDSEWSTQED